MLEFIKNIEYIRYNKLNISTIIENEKYLLTGENSEFILDIYSLSRLNKMSRRFQCLKEISKDFENLSIYEDMGILYDTNSYIISKNIIDYKENFDSTYLYNKGYEIGKFIKAFHKAFESRKCQSWAKHYNYRINRILHKYGIGSHKGEFDYIIFDFLNTNKYLIKERNCTTILGISSINDIIIDKDGLFKILENYKLLRSDAYFEFLNLNKDNEKDKYLVTGIINGYFNDRVPRVFFKLLAMYTIVENLYEIFDEEDFDVEKLKNALTNINELYDKFSSIYPIWYLDVKENL